MYIKKEEYKMNPVKKALESFSHNRKEAEKNLAVLEGDILEYQQSLEDLGEVAFWMIGKLYRRGQLRRYLSQAEREAKITRERIKGYLAAEKGLKEGIYEPAIAMLEKVIAGLHGAAQSEPVGLLFGAGSMAYQVEELKKQLIYLAKAQTG